FFFFSSRRRHTRSYGDWSSDVCSSDLVRGNSNGCAGAAARRRRGSSSPDPCRRRNWSASSCSRRKARRRRSGGRVSAQLRGACEIGRASCRERVEIWGGGGGGKEKRAD